MCGIAGFVDPAVSPGDRLEAVLRMCTTMRHRGPDDGGVETLGSATLGARRLAIFDPQHGHQPMASPDRRFHVVFNGAIYNFSELRDELTSLGWSFQTQCDTEVLVVAYAQWGERCVARFRGMFAFAAWDLHEQSLFLARDPFGIKPLYFRHSGAQLVFASELNALLSSAAFQPAIDPHAVSDFLAWFTVPAPDTIYRGVKSLRPGECATFRGGHLETRTWWNFQSVARDTRVCTSKEEFTRELRTRLEETTRAHVLADVPVGAFLSGGLDSAAIVGLMSRAGGSRLKTFSLGFPEAEFSESELAANTARHFGTEHHNEILTGAEVASDLEALFAAMDQPTGDGINTYYISRAARRGGVTVALSGLGGDELFGGYPSFRTLPRLARWSAFWRVVPGPIRAAVLHRLRRRDTRSRKLADLLHHARNIHEFAALARTVFEDSTRRSLLHEDVRREIGRTAPFHPELSTLQSDLAGAGIFEIISAWELRTYMPDVLLRDGDMMSMRHSLELRTPFVDRPLIEWLWRQPAEFKDDRQHPKAALARALSSLLPPGVAERRKRGFTLPFERWMRRELRPALEEIFSHASVERSGFFAREPVQKFWRSFLENNDDRQWSRVWSLAVLIHFTNRRAAQNLDAASDPSRASVSLEPSQERKPAFTPRKPVRALLLAPEIFASEGGIPRILQLYLRALADLAGDPEDRVGLIALNDPAIDPKSLRRCVGDRAVDWQACGRSKLTFIRRAMTMSRGCDRLVCGHVAQLPVALAVKLARPEVRYYLVAHGIEVWRPFTWAERAALQRADRIFCVSDFTRRELLKYCPLPDGRAVVLPNALDPAFPIEAGEPRGNRAPVIVTTARLTTDERYKGVEDMIRAMPAIRAAFPAAVLRIIGRGNDQPRLESVRDELRFQGAVEFLGFVDDRRLAAELRSCSLFALPSRKEGFGLVFIEAMANGRPCLGARAGGIPEVITDETGVLVGYGDVPAIAAAAIASLNRDWDESAILARARSFSYPHFRDNLASLLFA